MIGKLVFYVLTLELIIIDLIIITWVEEYIIGLAIIRCNFVFLIIRERCCILLFFDIIYIVPCFWNNNWLWIFKLRFPDTLPRNLIELNILYMYILTFFIVYSDISGMLIDRIFEFVLATILVTFCTRKLLIKLAWDLIQSYITLSLIELLLTIKDVSHEIVLGITLRLMTVDTLAFSSVDKEWLRYLLDWSAHMATQTYYLLETLTRDWNWVCLLAYRVHMLNRVA